jgi:hypothetical protein
MLIPFRPNNSFSMAVNFQNDGYENCWAHAYAYIV